MTRLLHFEKLSTHPLLKRDYAKLSQQELRICREFLAKTEHLDNYDYALALNRWTLDHPEERTTHHTLMWSLLTEAQTSFIAEQRSHP